MTRRKQSSVARIDAVVYVVDDDESMRRAIDLLMESAGLKVHGFATAADFLACDRAEIPACLILDVNLPDLNGLDLQNKLAESRNPLPIIFITGYGDIPQTVRAMKAGAIEFLTKPFEDRALLDAVEQAIEDDRKARAERSKTELLRELYALLTAREKEVMALVVTGMLNKQIAGALGASEATIKIHRGQVMAKMRAGSVVELVRKAERLNLIQ